MPITNLSRLPENIQGELRRRIARSRTTEEAARDLWIPVQVLLAGAAGARMIPASQRKVLRALEREGFTAAAPPAASARAFAKPAYLRLVSGDEAP